MSLQLRTLLRELNIDKALATTGFVSVFVALLVIARTPPATGYELSVYYAYRAYFWFLLAAGSACGIGILIRQAFAAQKSSWWLAGLCLVIVSNSVFLGLPFFRGYAFFPSGDAMTHVGMMKDIIATGHIGGDNFYPIVHVLGVSLLDIAALSYATVTNLLFVFFTMIYLLNIYLLSTAVANHRGQVLLITAFACPLIFSYFHTVIHPSMLSFFMLPLLLYFYHRRQRIPPSGRRATTVILLLLAVLIASFHPVTAIFAIVVILVLNLSGALYQRILSHKRLAPQSSTVTASDYIVPLTGVVAFLFWLLARPDILERIRKVHNVLFYGSGVPPPYVRQVEILSMSNLTPYQIMELFIYRYGAIFMCGIVGVIAVMIALRTSLSRKAHPQQMHFRYAVIFVVGCAASLFSLLGFTGELEPERLARFFLLAAPVVSGLAIYDLAERRHRPLTLGKLKPGRTIVAGIAGLLVLVASVLGILNVYGSPWVMNHNLQVSQLTLVGGEWFSTRHDRSVITATGLGGVGLRRLEDFSFGLESRPFPRAIVDAEAIPSGFGYDENSSIAETFGFQDRYLLISEAGRVFAEMLPENARHMTSQYTADDLARLRDDPAAAQIYANREFVVWRVYGQDGGG